MACSSVRSSPVFLGLSLLCNIPVPTSLSSLSARLFVALQQSSSSRVIVSVFGVCFSALAMGKRGHIALTAPWIACYPCDGSCADLGPKQQGKKERLMQCRTSRRCRLVHPRTINLGNKKAVALVSRIVRKAVHESRKLHRIGPTKPVPLRSRDFPGNSCYSQE
jgi:hypothetical protein